MNTFYHEFTLGFNYYYVVIVAMTVLMMTLGTCFWHLDRVHLKIQKRGAAYFTLMKGVAVVLDVITIGMIISESLDGIFQLFLNHLDEKTDPAWVLFLVPGFLMIVALAIYVLFYGAAVVGSWLYHGYLLDNLSNIRQEEKAKKTENEIIGFRVAVGAEPRK